MTTTEVIENQQQLLQEMGREMARKGRRLYLAGVGAVGAVGELGWKLGNDLVERGRKLEKSERPAIAERLRESRERVTSFGKQAERRMEERVSAALQRFGVPSRDDVQALIDRIEQLTKKVEGFSARS
jgi:poly(hydroxyalkanoate) granule-associated protein